jgi:pilus assembly protein Flp/PilA
MTLKAAKLARDESGATAIEYGLVVGAVALALLTAYWNVGESIEATFSEVAAAMGVEKQDDPRGIIFKTNSKRD